MKEYRKLCHILAFRFEGLARWLREHCDREEAARLDAAIKETRRTCDEIEEKLRGE